MPRLPPGKHDRVRAASRTPRPLAAANRTTPEAVLDILPPWSRVKTRWHNDR